MHSIRLNSDNWIPRWNLCVRWWWCKRTYSMQPPLTHRNVSSEFAATSALDICMQTTKMLDIIHFNNKTMRMRKINVVVHKIKFEQETGKTFTFLISWQVVLHPIGLRMAASDVHSLISTRHLSRMHCCERDRGERRKLHGTAHASIVDMCTCMRCKTHLSSLIYFRVLIRPQNYRLHFIEFIWHTVECLIKPSISI